MVKGVQMKAEESSSIGKVTVNEVNLGTEPSLKHKSKESEHESQDEQPVMIITASRLTKDHPTNPAPSPFQTITDF